MYIAILLFGLFFIGGMLFYYFTMAKTTEAKFVEEFSTFSSMIYKIKNFLGWAKPVGSVQDFQAWATNMDISNVPTKEFKSWIDSLELQEAIKFAKQVSVFSSDLNIELAWLAAEDLNNNAELKQAISEIIVFYCLAKFKASQITHDIKAWRAFQNWQQNPNSKEQREFGRILLAKLMEKQLISPMSPEFLLALKKERQEEAIASILLAAEKNPQAFHSILKTVVAPAKQAEPTPKKRTVLS